MNLVELAQRIKRFRIDRGLTLEQVASEAGLTRGWLSKVENFRVTPSLPAISGIAQALGVSLVELFDGLDERPPIVVVRADERLEVSRDEDVSSYRYASLAHARPARRMDPFVLTVSADDTRPALAHGGEEFLLVLSGRVRLEYGDDAHELGTGDAAYFDGPTPHRVLCLSKSPAQCLIVYHGMNSEPGSAADDEVAAALSSGDPT